LACNGGSLSGRYIQVSLKPRRLTPIGGFIARAAAVNFAMSESGSPKR
jgi:hypothetical protein